MLNTNFSPWPCFDMEEAEAVKKLILSNKVNYWTGTEGREFENEFSQYTGSKYSISLANGTVALDIAMKILGIKEGDEVIVTPRSFIASATSIMLNNAQPVFADIDSDSQNITAAAIADVLSSRTKAVICVHHAGWPCEMDDILQLAAKHNLFVIEDCAQAHGAMYKGKSAGTFGHINAWSFCQDKIITTIGEGGMITTDNEAYYKKVWSYRDHGKCWEIINNNAGNRPYTYTYQSVYDSVGTNYRLTEPQSLIGRMQIKKMPVWHEKRKQNALRILDTAKKYNMYRVPDMPAYMENAWYKLYFYLRPEMLKPDWDRLRILKEITSAGVPCYSGSNAELYNELVFQKLNYKLRKPLPVCKECGQTSLMMLIHPTLTEKEIDLTCKVLAEVGEQASK